MFSWTTFLFLQFPFIVFTHFLSLLPPLLSIRSRPFPIWTPLKFVLSKTVPSQGSQSHLHRGRSQGCPVPVYDSPNTHHHVTFCKKPDSPTMQPPEVFVPTSPLKVIICLSVMTSKWWQNAPLMWGSNHHYSPTSVTGHTAICSSITSSTLSSNYSPRLTKTASTLTAWFGSWYPG